MPRETRTPRKPEEPASLAEAPVNEVPLHGGHRQRVRRRFLREGLEGFEDHQVLEMLLFQALPRRDTNRLAHLLLRRFGSLSAVLEADPRDLQSVEGIGEQAASFLALIPHLTRRYLFDRANREKPILASPTLVKQFITPLLMGRTREVFYALCLDLHGRLLYPALIAEGTVQETLIHPRMVVEEVLRHRASKVILAHNHPAGGLKPSPGDINVTRTLIHTLLPLNIKVQDHIIVAGDQCLSMREDRVLRFADEDDEEDDPIPPRHAAVRALREDEDG